MLERGEVPGLWDRHPRMTQERRQSPLMPDISPLGHLHKEIRYQLPVSGPCGNITGKGLPEPRDELERGSIEPTLLFDLTDTRFNLRLTLLSVALWVIPVSLRSENRPIFRIAAIN